MISSHGVQALLICRNDLTWPRRARTRLLRDKPYIKHVAKLKEVVEEMEKKRNYTSFFNREAKKYDLLRGFYETGYGGMRERKLLTLFCRGTKVLNAACGTGRLLPFLAEKSFDVIGIDLSKEMLNVAKNKIKTYKNVHLVQGDAEFLPIRDVSFDEIVCSRAFKLFPNPLETLKEWARVLRKEGKAIVSLETSDPLWIKIIFRLNFPTPSALARVRFEWEISN